MRYLFCYTLALRKKKKNQIITNKISRIVFQIIKIIDVPGFFSFRDVIPLLIRINRRRRVFELRFLALNARNIS